MLATPDLEESTRQPSHHRLRPLTLVLSVLLVFIGYFLTNLWLVFNESNVSTSSVAPAAIVMGAAEFNGRPSQVFKARLEQALRLYEDGQTKQIFVVGGSLVGDKYSEAGVGRTFLIAHDVPASEVVAVPRGDDSYESIAAAASIIRKSSARAVIMVSDSFHSYRIVQIADSLGLIAQPSPDRNSPIMGVLKFDYMLREAVAVSAGRIFGYRTLSELRHGEPAIPLW